MTQLEENVLTFKITNHGGATEYYFDIAKSLSEMNRKAYRQHGLWEVLAMNLYVGGAEGTPDEGVATRYTVAVSGAPRTWMTRNALVKAYHLWIKQQREAAKASGQSIRPKWEDFKVYLNINHKQTGTIRPITGHMFGGTSTVYAGEWVHSQVIYETLSATGNVEEHDPFLTILGDSSLNDNTLGAINQYARSRAILQSPSPDLPAQVADTMYALAQGPLGEHDATIIDNMEDSNDEPPYSAQDYIGVNSAEEPLLYAWGSNASDKNHKINLNGFSVPNGLLEMQVAADLEDTDIYVQMVIGQRRDY
jgi:hypothetical protein